MTAMHLSKTHAAWKDRCAWLALQLIAANFLMSGGGAVAQEQPIAAVYKAHQLSFQYRSSGQFHDCYELEQRVAAILLAIGARDDIDVRAVNCNEQLIPEDPSVDPMSGRIGNDGWDRWGPSARLRSADTNRQQSAHLRIRLMMPVEVTPQVLAEINKDKSRRELVSRVTRNPGAALNDPIVFAARRQEVTLSNRSLRLRPEDCELLDQMTFQVLRRLDVRVVDKRYVCSARQPSNIPPQLTVETLVPTGALLPMPDPERKTGPKPSDDSAPETVEPTAEPPPQ